MIKEEEKKKRIEHDKEGKREEADRADQGREKKPDHCIRRSEEADKHWEQEQMGARLREGASDVVLIKEEQNK